MKGGRSDGRRDKDEKEALEPEAELFPKRTRKNREDGGGKRGQAQRPRPLLVGNGCNFVASFKTLFILKCIPKSRLLFLPSVQFSSSKMGMLQKHFTRTFTGEHTWRFDISPKPGSFLDNPQSLKRGHLTQRGNDSSCSWAPRRRGQLPLLLRAFFKKKKVESELRTQAEDEQQKKMWNAPLASQEANNVILLLLWRFFLRVGVVRILVLSANLPLRLTCETNRFFRK